MSQKLTQLYRHYDAEGNLLYVGISLSAVCRLAGHKRKSPWYQQIARIEIENHESREAAIASEIETIKNECPRYNKDHNDQLDYDEIVVATFLGMAARTKGFKNPAVMGFGGELFELPKSLGESLKMAFLRVLDQRGEDWVRREAKRKNIDLSVTHA